MQLTPADVHNVAFSKPPIGKRGYNEDEVDQFLDLVEDSLAQLQDENERLRAELDRAGSMPAEPIPAAAPAVDESRIRREVEEDLRRSYEAQLVDARRAIKRAEEEAKAARAEAEAVRSERVTAAPAPEVATADTHMQAARVLALAQEMADRLASDAQNESRTMLSEARSTAERQLADAETQSRQQVEQARRQAEKLVSDAEAQAAQTTRDAENRAATQIRRAEEKAAQLQAEAERKHTEIMATVKKQQTALEERIAELRTFEREYRTRMKTMLQSQLDELESRGTSAPSGN
ncbi:DivIVA-like cell division protein Wag31 [Corynebacterium uterequi]|uniref:Cell wall synthesis protein Wag31 n=1 Tax=Corynebacterium uterequi TaxID=1072256 RepID=A0A0G3HFC7_9CORY|nr:DivIVA domain-containing protein [Corynebacterium uterequi]AKK11450.1 DivIVA domain [Corynebacterium uterequi]